MVRRDAASAQQGLEVVADLVGGSVQLDGDSRFGAHVRHLAGDDVHDLALEPQRGLTVRQFEHDRHALARLEELVGLDEHATTREVCRVLALERFGALEDQVQLAFQLEQWIPPFRSGTDCLRARYRLAGGSAQRA
jgi:hypothetical protein